MGKRLNLNTSPHDAEVLKPGNGVRERVHIDVKAAKQYHEHHNYGSERRRHLVGKKRRRGKFVKQPSLK